MQRSGSRHASRLTVKFSALRKVKVVIFGGCVVACFTYYFTHLQLDRTTQVCPRELQKHLVLVTSLWADRTVNVAHRHEILSAITINTSNKYISSVMVILDESNDQHNCLHLQEEVRTLTKNRVRHKIRCIDRQRSQPTYYEMFDYTLLPELRRSVVILANADIVFDQTLALIKQLQSNTLLVVPTQGLHPTNTSMYTQYKNMIPSMDNSRRVFTESRCYSDPKRRNSWDAYIYHPSSITVDKSGFIDSRTQAQFFMNEIWAENSALHAIFRSSTRLKYVYEVCDHVHAWHFHLVEKMHKYSEADARVTHEGLYPNSCLNLCDCCSGRKYSGVLKNTPSICTARPDVC